MHHDFLGSEGFQGTHIDASSPFSSKLMTLTLRGGLWTFLANLALCVPPRYLRPCEEVLNDMIDELIVKYILDHDQMITCMIGRMTERRKDNIFTLSRKNRQKAIVCSTQSEWRKSIKSYYIKLFASVFWISSKLLIQISNPDWSAGQPFQNRFIFLKSNLKQKETALPSSSLVTCWNYVR